MATSSPNSSPVPPSPEEAEQLIRHICHHGFRTNDEMQQAIDSHFLPHADQILALQKTTHFTDNPPFGSVVPWALGKKCYPLLRYLIHNGWEMNRKREGMNRCPLLEYVPFIPILLSIKIYIKIS
jgi:hypothetical protein